MIGSPFADKRPRRINGYVAHYYGPATVPVLTKPIETDFSNPAAAERHGGRQLWPNPCTAEATVYIQRDMEVGPEGPLFSLVRRRLRRQETEKGGVRTRGDSLCDARR